MTVWPTLARSGVSAALLLTGLQLSSSSEATAETWRVVDLAASARIHLRQHASNHSKILAYIPGDARHLHGIRCVEDWCQIEFRGLTGWVFRDYLDEDEPKAAAKAKPKPEPEAEPERQPQAEQPAQQAQTPPETQQPQPQQAVADPTSRKPEDLEQYGSFRLAARGDGGTPVYVFPSESMPVAGRLPPTTERVDGLGSCVPNWCYIRSGTVVGWIQYDSIAFSDTPAGVTTTAAVSPVIPPADDHNAINNTVPTATNAAAPASAPEPAPPPSSTGSKSYALAGLAGNSSLPIRAEPEEEGRILGWIPNDAKNVEGLRKCVEQWCLIRYGSTEGWVARRHLADASIEPTQMFQVAGLPLWSPLKVLDQPGGEANVVGEIPSYATGIVPIGGCDKSWCHIRYLGVAGWVSSEHLEPQKR
jgi:SH3-like domain-containing protein